MRVSNYMLMNQAMYNLDNLRNDFIKAQNAVNGQVLQRPSDDPQKVVQAMDLSGAQMRLKRSQSAGDDANAWLTMGQTDLSDLIDQLQSARELAVQAGSPSSDSADARESIAQSILTIRQAAMAQLNSKYQGQYIFGGWKGDTQPFSDDGHNVTYAPTSTGAITRDIAPGLAVPINATGADMFANGDFMKTLADMADDLRSGDMNAVTTDRLGELDKAISTLTDVRSGMGARQAQVQQYQTYARESEVTIEEQLSNLNGGDLQRAVVNLTQLQTVYQTALASFSKALPPTLMSYMQG